MVSRTRPRVHLQPIGFALLCAAALIFQFPASAAERPEADAAKQFMTDLVGRAAEALTAEGRSLEQREKAFRELLRAGFDMPFIARVALGGPWKELSAPDRDTYTDLFSEYVLKTYAPRLGGFEPKRFHVTDATEKGRNDIVVETSIDQPSGDAIRAGWRIRLVDGHPRIVDIIVEGISMALNQRQEFAAVVTRDGVAGLMELLRARTERLPVEPPK